MQVQFSLDPALRREEFVQRALLFPPVITLDVEPHQLSLTAREALALCHPELPEVYALVEAGEEAGTENLWKLKVNPNAYASAEIVEMWAKDYFEGRRWQSADTTDENPFSDVSEVANGHGAANGTAPKNGAANAAARGAANGDEDEDWAKDVFDF